MKFLKKNAMLLNRFLNLIPKRIQYLFIIYICEFLLVFSLKALEFLIFLFINNIVLSDFTQM